MLEIHLLVCVLVYLLLQSVKSAEFNARASPSSIALCCNAASCARRSTTDSLFTLQGVPRAAWPPSNALCKLKPDACSAARVGVMQST